MLAKLFLVATSLALASAAWAALAAAPVPATHPAEQGFEGGSHIVIASLTPVQIANLATLARVWGFLKYHHPIVTTGQRQWDYDLFRILPVILAAPDRPVANGELLAWIEKLGPVPKCNPCQAAPSGDLTEKPPIAWIYDRTLLGVALSERLQSIYANRNGRQFYVSTTTGGNPSFDHELFYPQIRSADSGYQLLSLFRWWNIMQYWAPYRDMAHQDWDAILSDFIPRLALAHDIQDYQLSLFALVAEANDTHSGLRGAGDVRPPVGNCAFPVSLSLVQGKAVVSTVGEQGSAFKLGDVVEGIDGQAASSLITEWAPYYGASNEAALQRDLIRSLGWGECGSATIDIIRNGRQQRIVSQRIKYAALVSTDGLGSPRLPVGVTVIKLSSFNKDDLPAVLSNSSSGLIIDMRNYPKQPLWNDLGPYLADRPTQFVSIAAADLANPGAFPFTAQLSISPGPTHYNGKVVVLVDENTQSTGEFAAMAIRSMPRTAVVGSTTAGADGNVSPIPLPGGLSAAISGLGIYYPDHRPAQRVGIAPDLIATPTVQGVAAGRDEVLEAAVNLIEGEK